MLPGKWHVRDPDAKRGESWALLLNAAATPRNGRTQELASAVCGGRQLRRWAGAADRYSNEFGWPVWKILCTATMLAKERLRIVVKRTQRQAQHGGTDAPNKLEPRIDNGTCGFRAWNCADRVPTFQHVIRKCRSVVFQGPTQSTAACRARAQAEKMLSPSHSPVGVQDQFTGGLAAFEELVRLCRLRQRECPIDAQL